MSESSGFFFQNYLNNPRAGLGYNILSILFLPVALLYGLAMCVRRKFYKWGILRSVKLNHPVISVGNITTGGTGKTPFQIYLIKKCAELKLKPLLLSRGYGANSRQPQLVIGKDIRGSDLLPDEIAMIVSRYPDLLIAYGPDRVSAYRKAQQVFEFDVVILDDGFQHLKIRRDLDIVILDARHPFGRGRVLPSGNLREFKSALKKCDLVVVNNKFEKSPQSDIPHDFKTAFEVMEICALKDGSTVNFKTFSGQSCGLLTAIGDPGSFRRIFTNMRIEISREFMFRDHHDFSVADMLEIQEECTARNIKNLFTTEKDAVKLAKICFEKPDIYVIKIHLVPVSDDKPLQQRMEILAQSLKKS